MDLREVVDAWFQDDRGAAGERVQIVCQRRHVARLDGDRRSGHAGKRAGANRRNAPEILSLPHLLRFLSSARTPDAARSL